MLNACPVLPLYLCPLTGRFFPAAIATAAAVLALGRAAAGETIPPERAIAVMKSLEDRFRVLQWKAHFESAKLKGRDDLASITEKRLPEVDVEVVFDPVIGRYQCKATGTYEWLQGLAPTLSSIDVYSFDGEQHRHWKSESPGHDLLAAKAAPAFGAISNDRADIRDRDYMQSVCMMTGLAYMPPFFWNPGCPVQPLSSLLQTWIDAEWEVSIVENSKGRWSIAIPWEDGKRGQIHITYDLEKGGIVTQARWVNVDGIDASRVSVELEEILLDKWMPKSIKRVGNFIADLVDLKDIQINPAVNAETFRCEFPNGCKVTDFIEKKTYIVGSTSDRQSQLRLFASEHNITGDAERTRFSGHGVLFVANVCLVVILVTLYLIRRRQTK